MLRLFLGVAGLVVPLGLAVPSMAAVDIPELVSATKADDAAAVRTLLEAGADVNDAEPDGTTALHVACKHGHHACAAELLRCGASPRVMSRGLATPLFVACAYGQLECAKHVLAADPGLIDHQTASGQTALFVACVERHDEIVKMLLLEGGASSNIPERGGCTPWRK